MPNYRRWKVSGGWYFFTAVAEQRRPILTTELGRSCLRSALMTVQAEKPFQLFAVCLLPDHFHSVWHLPAGDDDFSSRWADLKTAFTKRFLALGGEEATVSESRRAKGERGVWQRRFWEHCIRDDDDLCRCVDYVHFNPIKHGLVSLVREWKWSSFHRFVRSGDYPAEWGAGVEMPVDPEVFGDAEFE